MDFSKNIKSFLRSLPIKLMTGQQMFLAIASHHVGGKVSTEVNVLSVRNNWSKSLLGISYNPSFYNRAQQAGWVDPVNQGVFVVNKEGIQHLYDISDLDNGTGSELGVNEGLYIFNKKSPHSFDKFLRGVFANSKVKVLVADSWVDEAIFDNVLDSIPKTNVVNLLYGQKRGTFDSRVARFSKEYQKFAVKKYKDLHDRFLVVDDTGYIIGSSLKNAAENSPTLIVVLGHKDSVLLTKFFQFIWVKGK